VEGDVQAVAVLGDTIYRDCHFESRRAVSSPRSRRPATTLRSSSPC